MSTEVVILAAGQGSRMKSALPKVLHRLAGKALVQHVIDTARGLGADRIHLVVGHGADQVRAQLSGDDLNWALQAQQLGTGHAVAQALPQVADDSVVLVLYGDVPLIQPQTLEQLLAVAREGQLGLVTVTLADPTGYGRIVRDDAGRIQAIVEHKDANEAQRRITEVNTGILAVSAERLKTWLPRLSNGNAQGEYYLTDIIAMAVAEQMTVTAVQPSCEQEVAGVNDRRQLADLERWYQRQRAEELMRQGVTLADPARFDLRGDLQCGQDVEIDVNVVLEGRVSIASGVRIGPNCVIRDSRIGPGVEILANSVIEGAEIGEGAHVGPFARLRPGTVLAAHSKIGNFVETKNAKVGEGSKINHLSYVGDAELGRDVNVGAGTITCNYDGANKHKTIIGDGVFVGSNSSLVAPVQLGEGATIGAGSTITKDVAAQQLAVARGLQRNIDGWQRPRKNKP